MLFNKYPETEFCTKVLFAKRAKTSDYKPKRRRFKFR